MHLLPAVRDHSPEASMPIAPQRTSLQPLVEASEESNGGDCHGRWHGRAVGA
jgi:hypothetical protein